MWTQSLDCNNHSYFSSRKKQNRPVCDGLSVVAQHLMVEHPLHFGTLQFHRVHMIQRPEHPWPVRCSFCAVQWLSTAPGQLPTKISCWSLPNSLSTAQKWRIHSQDFAGSFAGAPYPMMEPEGELGSKVFYFHLHAPPLSVSQNWLRGCRDAEGPPALLGSHFSY